MKLAQAHDVSAKMVQDILHKDHSDDRHGFLTILDNVLELAKGKEKAGWSQPQAGGLQKELEGI
jgi:hypothetical protein